LVPLAFSSLARALLIVNKPALNAVIYGCIIYNNSDLITRRLYGGEDLRRLRG
jgi:hypothetical protein